MVDALRVNTVLHTIALRRVDFDEETLNSTVYPLLLANRYRPRVGAIAEVEGGLLRRKLLGRALGSISSNPSCSSRAIPMLDLGPACRPKKVRKCQW
jgi:hypothetical protein